MGRHFHNNSQKRTTRKKYAKITTKTRINRVKGRDEKRKDLANKASKFILNLSDHPLTDIEKIALGRGLNFIPTPQKPKPNHQPIAKEPLKIFRVIKLRLFPL